MSKYLTRECVMENIKWLVRDLLIYCTISYEASLNHTNYQVSN